MYQRLRIIPTGHSHPVTPSPYASTPSQSSKPVHPEEYLNDMYGALVDNPYLPFFHVWKPNTQWTNAKWDRGTEEGLKNMPPAFWIGVVE
jgi:tRNA-splicing endonuclease subunit Sen54